MTEHGTYGLKVDGLAMTDSHFDDNVIRDSTLEENGDVGVFMRDSSANLFQNLTIADSRSHGLFLSSNGDGSPTCPNDNDFDNLTVLRSGGVGFRLNDGCPGNRLSGSAVFRQNRFDCISEGLSGMLQVGGTLTCEK